MFWGSGEVFEENLLNWQDNFVKIFTKDVITLDGPFTMRPGRCEIPDFAVEDYGKSRNGE